MGCYSSEKIAPANLAGGSVRCTVRGASLNRSSMRADLFVYGTLRRSETAHELLGPGAIFVREALTRPAYTLYQLGWYPGLVEGGSTAVKGELWSIRTESWPRLDRYEGVPNDYVRERILLADGARAFAYLFIGALGHAVPLPEGDWMAR